MHSTFIFVFSVDFQKHASEYEVACFWKLTENTHIKVECLFWILNSENCPKKQIYWLARIAWICKFTSFQISRGQFLNDWISDRVAAPRSALAHRATSLVLAARARHPYPASTRCHSWAPRQKRIINQNSAPRRPHFCTRAQSTCRGRRLSLTKTSASTFTLIESPWCGRCDRSLGIW